MSDEKKPRQEGHEAGTARVEQEPPETEVRPPADEGEGGTEKAPEESGEGAGEVSGEVSAAEREEDRSGPGKSEEKKSINWADAWREAKVIIWKKRWRLALGLTLMVVSRIAGLVLPASSKFVIDNVIGGNPLPVDSLPPSLRESAAALTPLDLLYALAVLVAVATVIQAATSFGLSQLLGVTAQRTITDMRRRVEQHVARLPTRYFDSTKSGILISRIMTDAEGIRNLVGTGLVQLTGSLVTAAFALTVLLWLNWQLTLFILVALLLFGGGMALAFRKVRPLFRERGKINAEVTGRLTELLGGIRIVKVYTAERREDLVFAKGVHRLLRNIASTITAVAGVSSFSSLVFGLVGVLMMVVGGRAILEGSMTLGDFVMYIFFTGMVAAPVVQITSIGTQISEAFAGLDRIRELMKEAQEDEDQERADPLPGVHGDITFEHVWFEYEPDTPVLKDVSFHAPAGSTTALVGSSGSGKSTLISLVTAFNRPQSGRVLVDGRDLATVRLRDYRSQLGVVLQDNFLFDGTVAENIAYGRPHATREDVEWAAKIAHVDDFVRSFEKGYDTVIGERGVKLSGGQRQRVAIARAILADPKILILDEATSSLDSESEGMIQEALARLRTGRTSFVIAHRLSTIQSADQILVIEEGEIVEHGRHEELLARDGRYRELYDKQYKMETNRFINPGEDFTPEPERETDSGRSGTATPSLARSD